MKFIQILKTNNWVLLGDRFLSCSVHFPLGCDTLNSKKLNEHMKLQLHALQGKGLLSYGFPSCHVTNHIRFDNSMNVIISVRKT